MSFDRDNELDLSRISARTDGVQEPQPPSSPLTFSQAIKKIQASGKKGKIDEREYLTLSNKSGSVKRSYGFYYQVVSPNQKDTLV